MSTQYKKVSTIKATIDGQDKELDVQELVRQDVTITFTDNTKTAQSFGESIFLEVEVKIGEVPVDTGQIHFTIDDNDYGYFVVNKQGIASTEITDVDKYTKGIYNITAVYLQNKYYNECVKTIEYRIEQFTPEIFIDNAYLNDNNRLEIHTKPNTLINLETRIVPKYKNIEEVMYSGTLNYKVDGTSYSEQITKNHVNCSFVTKNLEDTPSTKQKLMEVSVKFNETNKYAECHQITYNGIKYDSIYIVIDPLTTHIKVKDINSKYNQETYIGANILDENAANVNFGEIAYTIKDTDDNGVVIEDSIMTGTAVVSNGYTHFVKLIKTVLENDPVTTIEEYPSTIKTTTTLVLPQSEVTVGTDGTTVEYEATVLTSDNKPVTSGIVVFTMDDKVISSIELNTEGKAYASNIVTKAATRTIKAYYKEFFEYEKSESETKQLIIK